MALVWCDPQTSCTTVYEGYNVPYEESRARFREYLDVVRLAWTRECFSYTGDVET